MPLFCPRTCPSWSSTVLVDRISSLSGLWQEGMENLKFLTPHFYRITATMRADFGSLNLEYIGFSSHVGPLRQSWWWCFLSCHKTFTVSFTPTCKINNICKTHDFVAVGQHTERTFADTNGSSWFIALFLMPLLHINKRKFWHSNNISPYCWVSLLWQRPCCLQRCRDKPVLMFYLWLSCWLTHTCNRISSKKKKRRLLASVFSVLIYCHHMSSEDSHFS